MGLTQDLGAFVARVAREGVPQDVRDVAKTGFIDCIGTMIAGSREAVTATLMAALEPLPAGGAQLWFSGMRTVASEAALANGVAAHALDYDDVALRGHPSAAIVPAVLSLGQELGSSGAAMLDAYVAGYEVWANLVERETDMHHMKGWHPTGVFGAVGASAACAALRKLDAAKSAHALGLGASQSAGVMANFGSMAKPFHAGRAAQAGVMAARLAAAGFTASPDALEHPQGFLAAISPRGNVDRESPPARIGLDWQLVTERLNVKKYPTCYYTHRSLDAILDLLAATPIDPANVERVDVAISRENATVLRNHRPDSALAGKFSIEFAMAGALVARKLGLAQLDDEFVRSDGVQRLFERVHVTPGDTYDPDSPGSLMEDVVAITTRAGRRHESARVRHARGHARLPLAREELRAKFLDCLRYGRYEGDAAALFAKLETYENH